MILLLRNPGNVTRVSDRECSGHHEWLGFDRKLARPNLLLDGVNACDHIILLVSEVSYEDCDCLGAAIAIFGPYGAMICCAVI